MKCASETRTAPRPSRVGPVWKSPFLWILLLAFFNTLIIELFNHKAFSSGLSSFFNFIGEHPLALLVNFLLIALTLVPAVFLSRRAFGYLLISTLWIIAGAANGFILLNRMTPFTTADLTVFDAGLETLPNYLSTGYIILLVVAVVLLVFGLIAMFIWGPKCREPFRKRLFKGTASLLVAVGLLAGSWALAFHCGHLSTVFSNLAFAYEDYGFTYCFLQTWLNKGVRMPGNYSQQRMNLLLQEIEDSASQSEPQTDVNVIFVQLESFCDPALIEDLSLSADPVPNWHALKENYSSGYLTVPVLGAGTANTEFEVLTGMSTAFFGPGEYPYKPCLQEETTESIAYNLSALGYATHAIHNHRALFYSRNIVYANLGFDDFIPIEFMPKLERTPNNWAKDEILTSQVLMALDSTTDQQDFVFTVTVQCHGSYPEEQVLMDPAIRALEVPENLEPFATEYYVNELYETDQFIGQLIEALSERDERTVVVLYGDHLPALGLKAEQLQSGSLYKAEYVIWDNFGLEKQNEDLTSYQLSSTVLGKLGISEGLLTKYHQSFQQSPAYLTNLQAIEYDMLYGKHYLFGGTNPFTATDMKLGIAEIEITGIAPQDDCCYIMGKNFTPYCKVAVDDRVLKTTYLNPYMLSINEEPELDDDKTLSVRVLDKHKEVLGEVLYTK